MTHDRPNISGHPGHGVRNPSSGTPDRRAGSIRRTTTVDILRPHGLTGGLHLVGRARDLITERDGRARRVGTGSFTADVSYPFDQRVLSIAGEPEVPALQKLVGQPTSNGFRRRMTELTGMEALETALLSQLLDDLPIAVIIAGQAHTAEEYRGDIPVLPLNVPPSVCSGWQESGTMVSTLRRGFRAVAIGPAAPSLDRDDDPQAWHARPDLVATAMRRHRRIDVIAGPGSWQVQSFLRDSHWLGGGLHAGLETVLHEYVVDAVIRADSGLIESVTAETRVLPWQECASAVASPTMLRGQTLQEMSRTVGSFRGDGFCTHLNDVLRTLGRVPQLAQLLEESGTDLA